MLSVQILYQYAPGDAQVNIIVSMASSLLLSFARKVEEGLRGIV